MEHTSPDPQAVVRAANVRATLEAFRLLPDVGRRLIERHQLELADLRPENFVPLQRWLDALKEIEERVGAAKLRDVGRNIIESADIPPSDTETLLLNLNDVYRQNHKGNVGRYLSHRLPDGAVEIHCETPYPRHFEWGLVESFCRNQRANQGARFSVEFIEGEPKGERTCTLIVRKL